MTPQAKGLPAEIGKIAIQMREDRTRNMFGGVFALTFLQVGEVVPAIDDQYVIGRERGKFLGGDQGAFHGCSILCSRFCTMAAVAPQMR